MRKNDSQRARLQQLERVQFCDHDLSYAVRGLGVTAWGAYTAPDGVIAPPRVDIDLRSTYGMTNPNGTPPLNLGIRLTPAQARALAASLVKCADKIDSLSEPAAVRMLSEPAAAPPPIKE